MARINSKEHRRYTLTPREAGVIRALVNHEIDLLKDRNEWSPDRNYDHADLENILRHLEIPAPDATR